MNKHKTKIRTYRLWTYDVSVGRSGSQIASSEAPRTKHFDESNMNPFVPCEQTQCQNVSVAVRMPSQKNTALDDAPNFRQSVVDSRPLRRPLAKRIRIQSLFYEKDKTQYAPSSLP